MSKLEEQKHILNELVKKYGLNDKRVLEQSQKVDKLILTETKKINNL